MSRIVIVGAGAAGMMAAATIVESDPQIEVVLIEKNDGLGKKVIISGGGRCNVTTGLAQVKDVLKRYPRGGKFLSSAMYQWAPQQTYNWFERQGVPLKTEEDLRVFPQSNRGQDIVGAFERLFQETGVRVWLKASVTGVEKTTTGFLVHVKDREPLEADAVVLTTGGQAYRHTGSTGDGYAFSEGLGHVITKLAPSLNSFFTAEGWPKELAGVSFQRARFLCSTPKAEAIGPFLFTHHGVSGPAVFAFSSWLAFENYDRAKPLAFSIDLFVDETLEALRHRIEQQALLLSKKSVLNCLATIVPRSVADVVCFQLQIDGMKSCVQTSKKTWLEVAQWLKAIPLQAVGRGAGDEFVTAGGVDLREVDPSTMESKICPNLFFAGELLDIDGFTGGFNLQASWATGRLAGTSIAQRFQSFS